MKDVCETLERHSKTLPFQKVGDLTMKNLPSSQRKIFTKEIRQACANMNRLIRKASRLGFRVEVGLDSMPGWDIAVYGYPGIFGQSDHTRKISVWVKRDRVYTTDNGEDDS